MNYAELPDRELDALVAEKVMGVKSRAAMEFPMHYTSSPDKAMRVASRMRELGAEWFLLCQDGSSEWGAAFQIDGQQHDVDGQLTMMRAICIAALRALDA